MPVASDKRLRNQLRTPSVSASSSSSEDTQAPAWPAAYRYTSKVTEGRVYRVTVRGRFFELGDDVRAWLTDAVEDHDITKSAYTPEGTFTYDRNIYSFNLRYEIRLKADQPGDLACAAGLQEAELFLRTLDIGHRDLRATATDMSTIWDEVDRRRPR
jgi:Family of unknown function (DUF6204)